MDSRQERRFTVDQEVTVTQLGDAERSLVGTVVNISGRGMCLNTREPVSAGGAIKIEMADDLVLGEVVYCQPRAGSFQVGVALEQALHHTRELQDLLKRLLGPSRVCRP